MSGDRSMRVALISSGAGHVPSGIETWMLERERHLSSACHSELWAGREPVGTVSGKKLDCLAQEMAAASSTALLASAGTLEDGAETVRARARARRALGDRFREPGRVERDPIGRPYQAADADPLGSLAQPFFIAVLETLPVVHDEEETMVWQTGTGGMTVPMGTPGGAVPAFRKPGSDPVLRAGIALAARVFAEVRYAPGPVCAALEEEELRHVSEPPSPARR